MCMHTITGGVFFKHEIWYNIVRKRFMIFSHLFGSNSYDMALLANLSYPGDVRNLHLRLMTSTSHLFSNTHLFYDLSTLLMKRQKGLTGYCFSIQIDPVGFEQSDHPERDANERGGTSRLQFDRFSDIFKIFHP